MSTGSDRRRLRSGEQAQTLLGGRSVQPVIEPAESHGLTDSLPQVEAGRELQRVTGFNIAQAIVDDLLDRKLVVAHAGLRA